MVNYIILPLFAFVNAGVVFSGGGEVIGEVSIAVALGLLCGKFLGIYFFTWLAVKSKLTPMPQGMDWKNIAGVALLGGIGFTVCYISYYRRKDNQRICFSSEEKSKASTFFVVLST